VRPVLGDVQVAQRHRELVLLQRSPPTSSPATAARARGDAGQTWNIPEDWSTRSSAAPTSPSATTSSRRRSRHQMSCTPSSSSRCARNCPRASTSTSTSPPVPPMAAAHRRRPRGRLLRDAASGQGVNRHRHHRDVHRDRGSRSAPAKRSAPTFIVTATGFNMSLFGEHRVHRGRRAGRLHRAPHLARHHDQRRAQHGLHLRLPALQLDAARRHGLSTSWPACWSTWRRRARPWSSRACGPRTPGWSGARSVIRRTSVPANIMRSQDILFKPGRPEPWIHMLEYHQERDVLPKADLDDGSLLLQLRPLCHPTSATARAGSRLAPGPPASPEPGG